MVDLDPAVDAPLTLEILDIPFTCPLNLAVTCRDAPVHGGNWKNFTHFQREVSSDPEVHVALFNELFIWLLVAGFSLCFSDSVHLDVESLLSVEFLGSPRWPTVVGRRGLVPLVRSVVWTNTLRLR